MGAVPLTLAVEINTTLLALLLVLMLIIGAVGGVLAVRSLTGRSLATAREEGKRQAEQIIAESQNEAEKLRLVAERETLSRKERVDAEIAEAREEIRENERRLAKRDDVLHAKETAALAREQFISSETDNLRQREQELNAREKDIERRAEQVDIELRRVADLTVAQAREQVLQRAEDSMRPELAQVVRKKIEAAEEEAKERALEVVTLAIQRCATDHTSESTTRQVELPSDDMKGRIIGREGRNIRAIEKATGVDIIVDDTPGVIVVSCFDKIRQAVAVESLERLIADGRMHPSRIEEVVEKVREETHDRVMKLGKEAALEVNLGGLHPRVVEAMGKLHYRTSYAQNVLRHSVEVAFLSQLIADQLGLDGKVARRAGFLHDIGKAMDHEMEGGHPAIGMAFARQHGEKEEAVLNAIGGHHADIPATTFYTPIVMAADAISSSRPGARRESMERFVQKMTELQDIAKEQPGVKEAYAVQAGREVRVMVDANQATDDEAYLIAHDIARRISSEMSFPGEIKVTVLRETRAIEIAR